MIRETKKLPNDGSHDEMTFVLQSSREKSEYARSFPDPLPPGYKLCHKWDGMKLTFWPELDPSLLTTATVAVVAAPADSTAAATAVAVKINELQKLNQHQLITRASRLGATANTAMSKSAIIAEILKAEALAAEPATAEA